MKFYMLVEFNTLYTREVFGFSISSLVFNMFAASEASYALTEHTHLLP